MSRRINEMIVSMALVGAVLLSGYRLELKLNEYRIEKRIKTVTSLEVRKGRDVDFDALQERNKDVLQYGLQ